MALTKIVNGVEVPVTGAEEIQVLADWAAAHPEAPANMKRNKKKKIKETRDKLLSNMQGLERRIGLLARSLKIIAKYVTITDQADQDSLLALKTDFQKSLDLIDYADSLDAAVELDPNTDIEAGWPE